MIQYCTLRHIRSTSCTKYDLKSFIAAESKSKNTMIYFIENTPCFSELLIPFEIALYMDLNLPGSALFLFSFNSIKLSGAFRYN